MRWSGSTLPAAAQSTSSLGDARRKANDAAGRVHQLEAELGELDGELTRLEAERAAAELELERLRAQVQHVAIDRYTRAGTDEPVLLASDLNEGERARVLAQIVTQNDRDAVDLYAATKDRLKRTTDEVESRRADQTKRLDALEKEERRLADELDRLEELEVQRIENERRAAEEAARKANDAAAQQRVAQLAALSDGSQSRASPAVPRRHDRSARTAATGRDRRLGLPGARRSHLPRLVGRARVRVAVRTRAST